MGFVSLLASDSEGSSHTDGPFGLRPYLPPNPAGVNPGSDGQHPDQRPPESAFS